jgi:large subunit ribosomal protein L3
MAKRNRPRKGSLQYWPRKRAKKFLPRVNWNAIDSDKKLKGFLVYKVGMMSAFLKDLTPNSLTKDKNIAIPVTVLECPPMKIFSVRFYKNGKVAKEILSENLDKELKKKIKIPKQKLEGVDSIKTEDYDDIRLIFYSQVKNTNIKKTPDLAEIGLSGSIEEKLAFVKENLKKEFNFSDFFEKGELIDFGGLTKGKGFSGPVKRFGIELKFHKTEKGRRTPGSIAPWHPSRTTFRGPQAGQLGMFTRKIYNSKIILIGDSNLKNDFKNFGKIKTKYLVVNGSVIGPAKRQLIITKPLRKTKKQEKKNLEFIELR